MRTGQERKARAPVASAGRRRGTQGEADMKIDLAKLLRVAVRIAAAAPAVVVAVKPIVAEIKATRA